MNKSITKGGSLILLTHSFPFGQEEPFIAGELPYLAEAFDHVYIATLDESDQAARPIPANCTVVRIKPKKSWLAIFDLAWISEAIHAAKKNPKAAKVALKSWLNAMGYANFLAALIKGLPKKGRQKPIVYAYWMSDLAIAGALLKKWGLGYAVSRAHGWDLYEDRHPFHYLPFRPFLSKQLDLALPISENGFRVLNQKGFDQAEIARLGVAQLCDSPMQAATNKLTLVSISHLIPLKRIDLIIKAIQGFKRGEVSWVHFGQGPELARLQELSQALKIDYKWMGHVPNDKLKAWLLEHSDHLILFNSSRFEGIPVSMMEAMSMGIPCIGPDVGGVSEIIEHKKNGFLLRPEAVVEEAESAIKEYLMFTLTQRHNMKVSAFKTWQRKYNAEENYNALADKLLTICS